MKICTTACFAVLSFLTFSKICRAQAKDIYVEYKFENVHYSNNEFLICSNSKSKYSTSALDSAIKASTTYKAENNNYVLQIPGVIEESSLYLNTDDNFATIHYPNRASSRFIIDSLPDLNWKILPDSSKMFGPYPCQKAEAIFRGTEIIAYFSTDLPYSFGPWKFKNLPGLILEVQVKNSPLGEHWLATRIVYPYSTADSALSIKIDDSQKITFKEYIVNTRKEFEERLRRIQSQLGSNVKITKTESYRTAIEKKYEWE